MSFLVVLALMAMCRRLQLRTVIKFAYLTQEPEFDDDKTILDTVCRLICVR